MKKRILVVDDDTMNLLRTKRILEDEYDVLLVDSGHKALDKLERERIDLVLLDIEMPKMNGFETFERMKGIAAGVPVIFLTASGLEDDVGQRHQAGGGELSGEALRAPGAAQAGVPGV